ncbi:hypothetical protein HY490_05430 [Candidatus Woesearchaeota archaeon]|nr:hypothetical protein [Candidatus Woesearchaeota archaeon]
MTRIIPLVFSWWFLTEQMKPKVKPAMKMSEEFLDLQSMRTNVIIEQLEENIKLREMPIEDHLKKKIKIPTAQRGGVV